MGDAEGDATSGAGSDVVTEGATVQFGDLTAVDHLDLTVEAGTIFGFIGPSGSGKTSTVRLLTGNVRPTSGSVRVFGRDPATFGPADRRRMGYLPQLSVLYPDLTLAENLRFVAAIYGLGRRRRRVRDLLRFVELEEHRRTRLRDASGGMQRRLALAAALVHDPHLVFLDEPTAGIDPMLRRTIWDRFTELRDGGHTLFVTTQYVGEAAYCDRVGVLAEGRLIALDTPEGLRRQVVGGEAIDLAAAEEIGGAVATSLAAEPFVNSIEPRPDGSLRVVVDDADVVIPRVQEWFRHRDTTLVSIEPWIPGFDEVFVTLVGRETGRARARAAFGAGTVEPRA